MTEPSKAKQMAVTVINIIHDVLQTYDGNRDKMYSLEGEQQDILHEIELAKLDAVKRIYLCNELRRVRQERRRLKDENAALKHLYDFLNSNKQFENGMQKLLSEITKTEKFIQGRTYTARVRDDLTISEKKGGQSA